MSCQYACGPVLEMLVGEVTRITTHTILPSMKDIHDVVEENASSLISPESLAVIVLEVTVPALDEVAASKWGPLLMAFSCYIGEMRNKT